jgi:hypothetical protein
MNLAFTRGKKTKREEKIDGSNQKAQKRNERTIGRYVEKCKKNAANGRG